MRKFLYVSGAVVAIAAIAFVSYRFMGRRKVDMSAVDFISRDDRTGVARVRSGKKWALIDKDNYMLTGFDYELMNEFVEKMTVMRKDGKFGMLDSKGKEAIRPEYSLVFSSRGGMSIVA
ncbi:MAG: WG repeat-containing protein, partial [Rickettsiales bacterium]|nr:WG repeat-containing protein [Rickettsiales bacterium]